MTTVSTIADELGYSRARIHQLIISLGLEPVKVVSDLSGTGYVFYLPDSDVAKLRQHKALQESKQATKDFA